MLRKLGLPGLLLAAAGWKLWLILMDVFPFHADEAIIGLMARHILQGERPIFFYGQAYMGSLDAYLVAGMFAMIGEGVLAIRLIQVILYMGTIITTFSIARLIIQSDRSAWIAGLLLVVPTVNTTLYTTASLGGYGEAILLGNLILLVGFRIMRQCREQGHAVGFGLPGLLGFLVGLGLWANGLTVIYSLPVCAVVVFYQIRYGMQQTRVGAGRLLLMGLGFWVGALPWWIFAIQNGYGALITELLGQAVAVENQPWYSLVAQHAVNLLLFGLTALFGFRPPWEVRWLAAPLIPLMMVFWLGVLIFWVKNRRNAYLQLTGAVGLCLICGFLLTPFGVDPSGRYFLPLSVLFSITAGGQIDRFKWNWIQAVVVAGVMIFQGWGTIECALINPPGITTQFNAITSINTADQKRVIQFLEAKGETRGYTHYWVAYPMAFLSGERLIFAPRLPYHESLSYTQRDDRYPLYTAMVEQSDRTALITTRHPKLNDLLRAELRKKQITWLEEQIGDYHIFYNLSGRYQPPDFTQPFIMTDQ